MTALPLVSAVVPTRNRAALLREALDSVRAQEGIGTGFALEVIVVDDASEDATPEAVTDYPGVRYIRLPAKRGLSAARNAGLAVSRGQYVAFLDDDDLWLSHKLRVQVPVLEAHPEVGALYGRCIGRMDGQSWVYPHRAPSGDLLPALLKGNVCGNVLAFLFRRSAFDAAGGFDETLPGVEDYDMWLRMALHVQFLFAPHTVAVYRPNRLGMFFRSLADGSLSDLERAIVERTLARLPDTPASARLREDALTSLEARTVIRLANAQQAERRCERIIEALARRPAIARRANVRNVVGWTARQVAVAAERPLEATEAFCADIRRAFSGTQDADARSRLNRTLDTVWVEVAVGLLLQPLRHRRETMAALAYALRRSPSQLVRKGLRAAVSRVRRLLPV